MPLGPPRGGGAAGVDSQRWEPQPMLPASPAGSELGQWWPGLREGQTAVLGAGRAGAQSGQGLQLLSC